LVAILLGRLQMSTTEAIDTFIKIARNAFKQQKWLPFSGHFYASKLKATIERIPTRHTLPNSQYMYDSTFDGWKMYDTQKSFTRDINQYEMNTN
jgi:glutamate-1-semialdehyde aminotransferase